MKRLQVVLLSACLCTIVGTTVRAQMGMDLFKRPAIASLFKPVVGNGAVYQTTRTDQVNSPGDSAEFTVVGRDLADGKEGVWLEFGHQMKGVEGLVYSKMLITKDDFQIHRSIMQIPGHPAMEMRVNPSARTSQHMQDEINQWSQIGEESVTVPAGTFTCQHWKKNDGKNEIWANDRISPFGMVREVTPGTTRVLVKVITDAKDHITGTVTPFDPLAFRQMMMEQMQRPNPPNQ
jgi:hypothetical protein